MLLYEKQIADWASVCVLAHVGGVRNWFRVLGKNTMETDM